MSAAPATAHSVSREASLANTTGFVVQTEGGGWQCCDDADGVGNGVRIFARGWHQAMNTMTHEGFVATLEIDEAGNVIHGRVINTRATLTFEAHALADLHQAFADTIADYRAWCDERGGRLEKPYSGNLSLHIAPGLHRRIAARAAKSGESIKQFIQERLAEVAGSKP